MKKAGAEEKTAVEESRRNHSIQLFSVLLHFACYA